MATLDTTSFAAALKTLWPQKRIAEIMYRNQPFLAAVPKDNNFGGANRVVAARYATPGSASHTASNPFTAGGAAVGKYAKWTVTRSSDFGSASLTGEVIKASQGDQNALISALDSEMKGLMHTLSRRLGIKLFRNYGGSMGQINASYAGSGATTITLATVADVVNFQVGYQLQAQTTDGTSAGTLRAATATITGLDRTAGTLTVSFSGGTDFAANDYLFQKGDIGLSFYGLGSWLPTTAPASGDSFFGLDRSADTTRLAGVRYATGAGGPIEETLVDACVLVAREGGMIDLVLVNPIDWGNLVKALGSKVIRTEFKTANFGFQALEIMTGTGPVKVVADLNCPKGYAYGIQLDTWTFASLGDAPMIFDLDGQQLLRDNGSDSYTVRAGTYGQLYCEAPGYNFVATL